MLMIQITGNDCAKTPFMEQPRFVRRYYSNDGSITLGANEFRGAIAGADKEIYSYLFGVGKIDFEFLPTQKAVKIKPSGEGLILKVGERYFSETPTHLYDPYFYFVVGDNLNLQICRSSLALCLNIEVLDE